MGPGLLINAAPTLKKFTFSSSKSTENLFLEELFNGLTNWKNKKLLLSKKWRFQAQPPPPSGSTYFLGYA